MYKLNYFSLFILLIINNLSILASEPDNSCLQTVQSILNKIAEPKFKNCQLNILHIGVVADGKYNNQPLINKAIKKLSEQGGGQIIFPKGAYYCEGPILLENNIHLHFEDEVEIIFSQTPEHYLPLSYVRWEGTNCYNYTPYFYANNKKNIALTGNAILNGNGVGGIAEWRNLQKTDQENLRKMGKEGTPIKERVFGKGHFLRMSFLQFMNCENILIKGLTFYNVPFWVVHPTYCKNILIQNIHVNSTRINNDGIDLDSCEDVLVENCTFNTGDDAIAIKSGRDQDGWLMNKPSKNIVIRNCFGQDVLHGLAFGSEMSGGIDNIFVNNFNFKKVHEYAIQFKSNLDRGSFIKNVFIDGIHIEEAKTAIFFTNDYHSYKGGDYPSNFSNIEIKNLICNKSRNKAIDIIGLDRLPITNIKLDNILIEKEGELSNVQFVKESEFKNIFISKIDCTNNFCK